MFRARLLFPIVALAIVLAYSKASTQSLSYSSGQDVSPAFEGWEKNDDGTFSLVFGYMNRNWEEEPIVPIGPENNIEPGGPDQGQPTRLQPRRNRFAFRVRVPKDFGQKELVWTLTVNGRTNKAYASLKTDYFIDDLVMASETGALGAGSSSPEVRANKHPVVKIEGEKTRSVKVGQAISITALVTDDNIPRRRGGGGVGSAVAPPVATPAGAAPTTTAPAATPEQSARGGGAGRGGRGGGGGGGRGGGGRGAAAAAPADPNAPPATTDAAGAGGNAVAALLAARGGAGGGVSPPSRITVGKTTGLHLSWIVYRGPANVKFDPPQVKVWEDTRDGANSPWAPRWQPPAIPADGRWTAQATFEQPGTYVLHALADDGALLGEDVLTVNVSR